MDLNFPLIFLIALIPLVTGFIWYNGVFGKVWMRASGITPDEGKKGNMLLIFGLTYLFSLFICIPLMSLVIHQLSFFGVLANTKDAQTPGTELYAYATDFMAKHGRNFRTFKHGMLHGTIAALGLALPVIGIIGLFERRKFAYIAVHTGYWILTLALMGGAICQFL